jgi:SAM-dependent methyltransferase
MKVTERLRRVAITTPVTPYYRAGAIGGGPVRRLAAWDRYARLAKAVDTLGEDLLVLDVGCGEGPMARMLAQRHRLVGVDLDERALSDFSRYGLAVVADSRALPFEDSVFDVVALGQAIHGVPLDPVFSELARVTKPNGYIVLERAMAIDFSLWPLMAYWGLRKRLPGRLRLRSPWGRELWRTLRDALTRNGFEIIRREGLEISTGPLYSRELDRRLAEVADALPRLASQQLIVARRT